MKKILPILGVVLATAVSAHAIPVDAKYVSMGSKLDFKITVNTTTSHVWAGVMNLKVKELPSGPEESFSGFCIDPFQLAHPNYSGYLQTELSFLPDTPPTPNPNTSPVLSATQVETIEKLWAANYDVPMTNDLAAKLQLAIWMIVGGNSFSFEAKHGINTTIVQNMIDTANAQEARANLTRLSSTSFQDYVYFDPSAPNTDTTPTGVPDAGSTAAMLGLAMGAMLLIARRRQLLA